jgi:hypothetical protein
MNLNAIHLLEKNLDKRAWYYSSVTPSAISTLEKNIGKIHWCWLSENLNAIHLLEKNLDKVDWSMLSRNTNAIHILEKNMDKIDWFWLSSNSNIFELDLGFIKSHMDVLLEELMQKMFHPTRVMRIYNKYGYKILEDEFMDMDKDEDI